MALLAALGGTAVALPGKNGVKSDDIAANAVRSSDIKSSNVASSDVKNNSLSGSDINESTLGEVPNATNADKAAKATTADTANTAKTASSANTANTANTASTAGSATSVGGVTIRAFKFSSAVDAPAQTVLNLNGLQLVASCSGDGATLVLNATTTVDDSQLDSYSVGSNDGATPPHNLVHVPDMGASIPLLADGYDAEVGHTRLTKPQGGGGVSVEWHAASELGGETCNLSGIASAF